MAQWCVLLLSSLHPEELVFYTASGPPSSWLVSQAFSPWNIQKIQFTLLTTLYSMYYYYPDIQVRKLEKEPGLKPK